MRTGAVGFAVFAWLLCSITGNPAAAQSTEEEEEQWSNDRGWSIGSTKRGRELGRHLFIPSDLVIDPFATTYFRSTTGAGFADSTGPNFSLSGLTVSGERDFSQAVLSQAFQLQVAPWPWLAVRLGGT